MVSIITVVYNGAGTILDCLESVKRQNVPCEHIIIDGQSTDGTLEMVLENAGPFTRVISEPDNGIYDAMNKGIRLATGKIIGILNADDFFINEFVIQKVVTEFERQTVDAIISNIVFVSPENLNKIVRYYSSADFKLSKFSYGWMPPHPAFFVKRECYDKFGLFKTDYAIAADFELMARFMFKHKISYHYLPEVLVKMRTGGISTKSLKSNVILNCEVLRACKENGIATNIFKIYSKYFKKCLQLFARPN